MIVCHCKNINSDKIKKLIENGCETIKNIQDKSGACTDCKNCAPILKEMLKNR